MSTGVPLADGVQQQNQDALVTVLGVCLLIIVLCAFAGVTLLLQQLQRSSPSTEPVSEAPVLTRRTAKPVATTTQFRPLSENLRHRSSLHLASVPQAAVEGSSSLVLTSPGLALGGASTGTPPPAAAAAAVATLPKSANPLRGFSGGPVAADGQSGSETSHNTPVAGGPCPPKAVDASGTAAARPMNELDTSLLSRIDEALASGSLAPKQATELLQWYGCDVDELLRVELGDPCVDADAAPPAQARLASTSLLAGRRPPSATAAAVATDLPALSAPATRAPMVKSSSGRLLRPPHYGLQQHHQQVLPGWSVPLREGSGASLFSSSGGGGGGGAGGPVIDDALLLKLDMALASGCVRPEQATQLLKSYGCDVEELLREELRKEEFGDGGAGSSS